MRDQVASGGVHAQSLLLCLWWGVRFTQVLPLTRGLGLMVSAFGPSAVSSEGLAVLVETVLQEARAHGQAAASAKAA